MVKLYFEVPVDCTEVAERIPTGTHLSVYPGSVNTPPSSMLTPLPFHRPVFLYMRILSAITTDNNMPFGLAGRDHTMLQSSKTLDRRTARQNIILIICNQDATDLLQNHSTCFGCPSNPSSGVHKIVNAPSGTGHSV